MIHSANPQSRTIKIIVFAHVVHPLVRPSVPTLQNPGKLNKAKTIFATGETVGLAEWIIDDTCLVSAMVHEVKEDRIKWHCLFHPPAKLSKPKNWIYQKSSFKRCNSQSVSLVTRSLCQVANANNNFYKVVW